MIGNDASDDGHAHAQAESDAPRLGGEVGFHNLVDDSRIDARAVVVDGDAHALGRGTHSDADEGLILAASRKLGHAARGLGSRDQVGVLILDSLSSVDDAWAVIDEIVEDGDELALVLSDHRLPGKSGVDFLVELMKDERFGATRTVLVTGQADQSDTIRAVNQAGLDYYIGKPWNPDELRAVVRDQLTEYVLESDVNPLPYVSVLDGVRVMEAIR